MADQDKITQPIEISGEAEIKRSLDNIGKAGEQAFGKIKAAADKSKGFGDTFTKGTRDIERGLQGVSNQARVTGAQLVTMFRSTAIDQHTQRLQQAEVAGNNFGRSIRGLAIESKNFASGILQADIPLTRFIFNLKSLLVVAGGIAAVKGLIGFIQGAAKAADETEDLATSVGLTIPEFKGLELVMAQFGIPIERARLGLAKLNAEFQDARDNGAENSKFFKDLGKATGETGDISIIAGGQVRRFAQSAQKAWQDIESASIVADQTLVIFDGRIRNLSDTSLKFLPGLLKLSDMFSKIKDPAKQAALAVQLLGARLGPSFVPFLRLGREGIQEFIIALDPMLKNSEAATKSLSELNDKLELQRSILSNLGQQIIAQFSPALIRLSDAFTGAILRNWERIIAAAKPLTDAIAKQVEGLILAFEQNPDRIIEIFDKILETVLAVSKGVVLAVGVISAAFRLFAAILEPVAKGINALAPIIQSVFGVQIPVVTGLTLAWTLEIIALVGGFGLLLKVFSFVGRGILIIGTLMTGATTLTGILGAALGVLTGAVNFLAAALLRLGVFLLATPVGWAILTGAAIAAAVLLLINFGPELWAKIVAAWDAGLAFLTQKLNEFLAWFISTFVGRLLFGIGEIIAKLLQMAGLLKATAPGVTTNNPGDENVLAGGGSVRGPGSSTSDSIPAWLSNNEFVTRAKAVRYYGVSVMRALNNMQIPRDFFNGMANGGLSQLQALRPAPLKLAQGGSVQTSAMRPFNLTIGADTFAGLLAPEDVAQKMVQVATTKQLKSAGRKPAYYGQRR